MKILIVYPYFLENRINTEDISAVPIGAYYVGAMLKSHGYDVKILNLHDAGKDADRIKELLVAEKPDVIGFSIFNANRWGGIDIARMAKQLDPEVITVFGGIGATYLWEHLLGHFPAVDYVVLGEGEYTFLNLVRLIERDDLSSVYELAGIACRDNGKPKKNRAVEAIARLDDLPDPARYFTCNHVVLTRGCPGNCNFCGSPTFWGRKVRFHSADYFVRQVRRLAEKGVSFFYVSDDTFTLKKPLVIDICKQLSALNLNIAWAAISRVNYVDRELLTWMRRAGCIQISYGVESGSEKIRDFFCKNISTQDIRSAFRLTKSHGIMARAYFIYGAKGETADTIDESIRLLHDIGPLSTIFYILDIFPGTRLYEDFLLQTHNTDDIWLNRVEDILYFETDDELDRDMVLDFGNRLRTAFFKGLPEYVRELTLVDDKTLYPHHADFLSRLAMTFSHGDYAANPAIIDAGSLSNYLHRKALTYSPDHRAFLGLGIALQKKGDYPGSEDILAKGISHFPDSPSLHICLAVSLMNRGEYREALDLLLKFHRHPDAVPRIAACYEALGDRSQAGRHTHDTHRQP
ncbi:MAG: radical SAM protein [Desulfobacteraceae bacterium]|nr:radical SAM protein [Desulfobacteraceae bacterium]